MLLSDIVETGLVADVCPKRATFSMGSNNNNNYYYYYHYYYHYYHYYDYY